MGGKRSRDKGLNYERQIAREFREDLGFKEAARQLEFQIDQAQGIDLRNTGPWDVQIKRYKDYVPMNRIEEIKGTGISLLISKPDRKPALATLYWDDLKRILKDIGEAYGPDTKE